MKNALAGFSLSILAVAGCVGSDSQDVERIGPGAASLGAVLATLDVDYDDVAGEVAITDGISIRILSADPDLDSADFLGFYSNTFGNNYALIRETSSGRGFVAAVLSPDSDLGLSGSFFERVGDTLIPNTGSANYNGNYVAWISTNSDKELEHQVTGSVVIDVDFAASSVSGLITDRMSDLPANTFADVQLVTGSIVNGQFSGTTTGGEIILAGSGTAAGEYSGLLTGANAQEVVGGVQITHTIGGTNMVESGAFVAE